MDCTPDASELAEGPFFGCFLAQSIGSMYGMVRMQDTIDEPFFICAKFLGMVARVGCVMTRLT